MGIVTAHPAEGQRITGTRLTASAMTPLGGRAEVNGRSSRERPSRGAARTASKTGGCGPSGANIHSISGLGGVHEVSSPRGAPLLTRAHGWASSSGSVGRGHSTTGHKQPTPQREQRGGSSGLGG